MAKQTIDLTTPNPPPAAPGDPLLTAFTKVNSNFDELYDLVEDLPPDLTTEIATLTTEIAQRQPLASNLTALSSGPVAGFRNKIINGAFEIWQRGTTFTTNLFTADRWLCHPGTGGSLVVTRGNFATPHPVIPGNPQHFIQIVRNAAASGPSNFIAQRVEDVRILAGRKVTASFWLRCVSGTQEVRVVFGNAYGTGGSPAEYVVVPITCGDVWTRFEITAELPGLAGKTLGGGHHTLFALQDDNPSRLYQVQVYGVQLEEGEVATPFERRPPALEMVLCQRYFETSYPHGVVPGTAHQNGANRTYIRGVSNSGGGIAVQYRVEKRVQPTLSFYSPQSGAAGKLYDFNGSDVDAIVSSPGSTAFMVHATTATQSSLNISVHWTADAEL